MTRFDQLPSELISLILMRFSVSDLYTCTLTNHAIYKEVMSILWRSPYINNKRKLSRITAAIGRSPHSPGDYVQSVTFVDAGSDDMGLVEFILHVPHLKELQVSDSNTITDTSFQHVPRCCPHLTSVALDACDITQESLDTLGRQCHQLELLQLVGCAHLNYSKALFAAFQSCSLTEIQLAPRGLNATQIHAFAETIAGVLHRDFPHLKSLFLGSLGDNYTTFITTANANGLVWPHLTKFYLTSCHTLDDSMAIEFIQAHHQFQRLQLECSDFLTDRTLDAMATYLPDLKEVLVSFNYELSASGICRLIKNAAGCIEDGAECYYCSIFRNDDDFPPKLGKDDYRFEDIFDDGSEVVWFSGYAFANDDKKMAQKK